MYGCVLSCTELGCVEGGREREREREGGGCRDVAIERMYIK